MLKYVAGIPTEPQGGNHTRAFTKSAASPEGHIATLNISKALAATGVRVVTDDQFFAEASVIAVTCDPSTPCSYRCRCAKHLRPIADCARLQRNPGSRLNSVARNMYYT